MSAQFQRHGSYYTPVNSDCVEFCPHPTQQQYLFTGHYELLSTAQGKLGQMCLSEVTFGEKKDTATTMIPMKEYCTATNENQEAYMTRTVDIPTIIEAPIATYGQCTEDDLKDGKEKVGQEFIKSNTGLVIHDYINIPALLDAKWSYQPLPIYQVSKGTTTTTTTNDEMKFSQEPIKYQSLIAAALEDGSARLYSICDNKIQPESAVQISTNGICLYIDWSNRQRYSYLKAIYPELFPEYPQVQKTYPGEDDMDEMFTKGDNYVKFWKYYDRTVLKQCKRETTPKSINEAIDVPQANPLTITPHHCVDIDLIQSSKTTSDSTNSTTKEVQPSYSNIGDFDDAEAHDDDYYEYDDIDAADLYKKGKTFNDNFFACSLSDGSVGIIDVLPIIKTTVDNNLVQSYSLELTHHWQAHQAECWVASIDTFNNNLIYTGADDCLMKMWDLRLINTVNQHMEYLDINPTDITTANNKNKGTSYKSLDSTSCQYCQSDNLSLKQSQSSSTHGVGFDISMCTSLRGKLNQCNGVGCFCNARASTDPTVPTTAQYRYNIPLLSHNYKFNQDFTPVDDAYALLTNNQHQAGVIEIKPHPYNPFLLLTGSYDNHVSLYDKRNLRKPISRVETGGGAWRIKFNQNPIYSNQFLLVNMYDGVKVGTINGMDIDLANTLNGDEKLANKHQRVYNNTSLFQPIAKSTSIKQSSIPAPSYYPSAALSQQGECNKDKNEKEEGYVNGFMPAVLSNTTNDNKENNNPELTNQDIMHDTELPRYINQIYNFGTRTEQTSMLSIGFDDVKCYEQHGPKSIVYGGDWCMLNNISDKTEPSTNNIAVTCSFYNKRTDCLNVE